MCHATPRGECELTVSSEAPSQAREFLRRVTCPEHGGQVLDDAVLMVSELVTNSVQHGGPPLVVAAECDGDALRVLVRDGSTTSPEPRNADADAESGRGLALVQSLSQEWGVQTDAEGKHVWFIVS